MMIFEKGKKINFVDKNNVLVGYDMGQFCCENAGWFISVKAETKIYNENYDAIERVVPDVEDYDFDKEFFEEVKSKDVDEGGMVRFRIMAPGKPDLYLHLFNCHNGYYGHGFTVEHSGQVVKEGSL